MSQTEHTDIQYRLMVQADLPEVLTLLSETFAEHGPLEKTMGITAEEFKAMAEFESAPVIGQNLSVVGTTTDGQIVCAIIAFDALTEEPEGEYPAKQKYRPIGAMVNPMFDGCVKAHCDGKGQLLYMFLVAIDPNYQGRGLLRNVTRATLEQAGERGYEQVFAISTVLKAEASLRNLSFRRLEHVPYKSFKYQGKHPFADIIDDKGQQGASVMYRTIDVLL